MKKMTVKEFNDKWRSGNIQYDETNNCITTVITNNLYSSTTELRITPLYLIRIAHDLQELISTLY